MVGHAVAAVLVERRPHRLAEPRAGIAVDPRAALLEDDLALGGDSRLVEDEVGHPVRLERHHRREVLLGDILVVGGDVVGGEGVLVAADRVDHLREFALGMGLRALEHQVLEEMGDTRFARPLVGGAGLVPDHVGDDRRAMVGDDHHLQAVVEGEAGGVLREFRRFRRRNRHHQRDRQDEGEGAGGGLHAAMFLFGRRRTTARSGDGYSRNLARSEAEEHYKCLTTAARTALTAKATFASTGWRLLQDIG